MRRLAAGLAFLFLALSPPPFARAAGSAPGEASIWDRLMEQQQARQIRDGSDALDQGRYKDAVEAFQKAAVSNPDQPLAHVLLGAALYWSGQVDKAMDEYRQAIKLNPKDAQARQLLGIAYAWKGDIESSYAEFAGAAALAPDRADVQMNLGSVLEAKGDLAAALEHFRDAVALSPRHPLYRFQLGTLYVRLGRDAQARDALQQALDIYPGYQDALLELGSLEERQGDGKAAIGYFRRAVGNRRGDGVARFRLAAIEWREGRRAEALATVEGGLKISPLESDGRLALSVAYRAGGKPSSASPSPSEARGPQAGPPEPSDPADMFKRNLERLPADRKERVRVEIVYLPQPELKPVKLDDTGRRGKTHDGGPRPIAVKREFVLPADDPEGRERQLQAVADDLRSVLAKQPAGQLHLGMDVKFEAGPEQARQDAKLGYQPREEQNDLGLWVSGTGWTDLVKEEMEGLPADALEVRGLGHLTLGEGPEAGEAFFAATQRDASEAVARLGLGVALVVVGRDEQALKSFNQVLALDPGNAAAKDALKWLATETSAK